MVKIKEEKDSHVGRNTICIWETVSAQSFSDDQKIDAIFDGWTNGSWQRILISQYDSDSDSWKEISPGENWRMERLSQNSVRSYADKGDPFDVSLSTVKYVITWLDADRTPVGETEYDIEHLNVFGPNDWNLRLSQSGVENDQYIDMTMFGDLYKFVLWSRIENDQRRDQWIAVSRRVADQLDLTDQP